MLETAYNILMIGALIIIAICLLLVIFKSIKARDGGEFTNQSGQVIKYAPSYQVKFDEIVEGEAIERKIKVSKDDIELITSLQKLRTYSRALLGFDVGFNATGCYLKLISASPVENK